MNEIVAIVESVINGTKAKQMRLNSIGGVVGTNHRNHLNAWQQLRTRLVQCTTLGRLRLVRTGADENEWEIQLLPMDDDNAKVGVSNGNEDNIALANMVEAYVRTTTKNGQGTKRGQGASLPVLSIGGVMCSRKRCTTKLWRALVAALKQGRVGNIVMEMPTTDQGSWRIRVIDDMGTDDDDPTFSRAIVYSIAFVGAHPLCHIDVLGANVGSYYGSAIWQRVKSALIRSGSEKANKTGSTVWRNNAGLLALDKSALASRADTSTPVPLSRVQPVQSPPVPTAQPVAPPPVVQSNSASMLPPQPLAVDEPMPAPPAHQSALLVKPEPAAVAAALAAAALARRTGVHFVNSVDTCRDAFSTLLEHGAVGVDCEGSLDDDDDFYLRLVQVGAGDGSEWCAFVFDMQFAVDASAKRAIEDGLRALLSLAAVVKVFHDLRHDVPALCRHLRLPRVAVATIFDTQVACETLIDLRLLPRGFEGPRASLSDVLTAFQLPPNPQKRAFQAEFGRAGSAEFWRRSVLTAAQVDYAAQDVRHLVNVYRRTMQLVEDGMLSWSQKYADWFSVIGGGSRDDDFTLFDVLSRLSFRETDSSVPRIVQTVVDGDDAVARAQSARVGMPPPSALVSEAFGPEFDRFVAALPAAVRAVLLSGEVMEVHELRLHLVEVIIDAGDPVVLYLRDGMRIKLRECIIEEDELEEVVADWSNRDMVIGHDNRLALEQTLHRVSVKRGRLSDVVGLTCRIGKHCPGAASLLRDVVGHVALGGKSVLLLGPPGSGKTTLLREIARLLADEYGKRVDVVDSSNEIAGDGARKHYAIGDARRTSVPLSLRGNAADAQALVMREVIANHTPQVLVVDELGTREQCRVAGSIAERGAALVATVHGRQLVDLRRNTELNSLLGGFQAATVSDAEWRRLGAKTKNIPMRSGAPVFDIVVELRQVGEYIVHENCANSVDALLALPGSETPASVVSHRWSDVDGGMWLRYEQFGGSRACADEPAEYSSRPPRNARGWLKHLQQ
jgi:stage III sporulation protein SpoIIIAA